MQLSLPARIYTCESLSRNLLSNDIGDVTSPAWWKKVAAMPIIGATWRIRYSICRYQYRPVIDHFVLLLQVPPPSEAADLERSVDATMHVRPSFPLPIFFFFFCPSIFFSRFLSPSHRQKFSTKKKGAKENLISFSERATRSLFPQMDRSIVLWYFEFGCLSFSFRWKKKKRMLSRKLIETLRNLKSNANSTVNVLSPFAS